MLRFRLLLLAVILLALPLTACAPAAVPTTAPAVRPTLTLRAYPSATLSPTPLPTGLATSTPTPTATATPEPVTYTVAEGDDMFIIALRHGVTLDALKAANPTVIPNAMGLGTVLLIPITPTPPSENDTTVTPSPGPTAIARVDYDVFCYPESFGGLYCLVLVENDTDKPLENVSALVTLDLPGTDDDPSQVAITPLNLLPAQTTLPAITYFAPPLPQGFTPTAFQDYALPVPEDDIRYLEAGVASLQVELSESAASAQVSGQVVFDDPSATVASVWVLAIAYDQTGQPVGIRRWEFNTPVSTGQPLDFEIIVFSLGPQIDRVDCYVEVRSILP